MVNLRVAREDDREELPIHFEGVPLKRTLKIGGWPLAGLGTVAGIATMAARPGIAIEVFAAVIAAAGVIAVTGLYRCRRFELVVGEKWVFTTLGPFKRHLPLQLIEGASERPATSWRRLYSDREVVLRVPVGSGEDPFPSRAPSELIEAIVGVADDESSDQQPEEHQ